MEKIRLANKSILDAKSVIEKDNVMSLEFAGLEITDLRKHFDKPYNLSTIEILTEGGSIYGSYNGYTKVDKYVSEISDSETLTRVFLVKPSEIEARLSLQESVIDALILSDLGAESGTIPDKLFQMFKANKIDEVSLDIAVNKHWISSKDKEFIVANK